MANEKMPFVKKGGAIGSPVSCSLATQAREIIRMLIRRHQE